LALAEKIDGGKITEIDANAELSQVMADAESEGRRRANLADIADAQQRRAFLASLPVSCYTLGGITNCY